MNEEAVWEDVLTRLRGLGDLHGEVRQLAREVAEQGRLIEGLGRQVEDLAGTVASLRDEMTTLRRRVEERPVVRVSGSEGTQEVRLSSEPRGPWGLTPRQLLALVAIVAATLVVVVGSVSTLIVLGRHAETAAVLEAAHGRRTVAAQPVVPPQPPPPLPPHPKEEDP